MLLRALHSMSLDVALGAMGTSVMFSYCCGVPPDSNVTIALGLTVWIIYTMDHLMDARAMGSRAVSYRHRFHVKYFKAIAAGVGLAVGLLVLKLLLIPGEVIFAGIWLSFIVSLYLLFQHRLNGWKEPFGAALYTAGIALPAWSTHPLYARDQWMVLLLILLTALINLTLFSWLDWRTDQAQGQSSLAVQLGRRHTAAFLKWLFFALFMALIINELSMGLTITTMVIALMNAGHLLIYLKAPWFRKRERFRWAGEMVFLFTWLVWMVP